MGQLGTRARVVLDEQFTAIVLVLLVVAALGGWVTYATHVEPGTHVEEQQGPTMEKTGTYSHQATVTEENPIFPVGTTLRNRSIYFTNVAPIFEGSFAYTYTANEGGTLDTSVTLDLVIRGVREREATGGTVRVWQTADNLGQAERTLEPGQQVTVPFSINMSELATRRERLTEDFGGPGNIETVLVAEVDVSGTVNGEEMEQTRQYQLPIEPSGNVYRVDDPGPVTNTTTETETVTVQNTYGPLRSIGGPALLVLALVLLVGLIGARYGGRIAVSEAELTRLAFRFEREEFDDWITVGHVPDDALEGPRIGVGSLEGLVDIAIDTDERVIEDDDRGLYVVLGRGRHHVYEPPGTRMLGPEDGDSGGEDGPPNDEDGPPDDSGGPSDGSEADASNDEDEASDDTWKPGGSVASTDPAATPPEEGSDAAGGAFASNDESDADASDDEPPVDRSPGPFRRAREIGPVFLIPAAWAVVAAAHLGAIGAVTDYTLFIAHVVMTVLLFVFAVTGYADMQEGTLQVWWGIIAVGFLAAAAGTAGLRLGNTPLQAAALYGWMLLPVAGLVDTGRRVTQASVVYFGGAVLCVVGAAVYAAAPLLSVAEWQAVVAGIAAVGLGQTAGILDAALRY